MITSWNFNEYFRYYSIFNFESDEIENWIR